MALGFIQVYDAVAHVLWDIYSLPSLRPQPSYLASLFVTLSMKRKKRLGLGYGGWIGAPGLGGLVLLPPGKKKTAVKDKLQIAMCCVSVESGVRGKS